MKTAVLVIVLIFNVSPSFASVDVVTGSVLFYGDAWDGCGRSNAAVAKARAYKEAELLYPTHLSFQVPSTSKLSVTKVDNSSLYFRMYLKNFKQTSSNSDLLS